MREKRNYEKKNVDMRVWVYPTTKDHVKRNYIVMLVNGRIVTIQRYAFGTENRRWS